MNNLPRTVFTVSCGFFISLFPFSYLKVFDQLFMSLFPTALASFLSPFKN